MFQLMSFVTNHFVSVQLGSQMNMLGQTIGFTLLTAKMIRDETYKVYRLQTYIKPMIEERKNANYPDVRLDINGVPKFSKGQTLH